MNKWARVTKQFSFSDPFVCKYHKKMGRKDIEEIYHSIRDDMFVKIPHRPIRNDFHGWMFEMVEWYNDFITAPASRKKKRQMYVYGSTNSGKTRFFEYLFAPLIDNDQKFEPCKTQVKNNFSWQYANYNPRRHNLAYFEEANFKEYHQSLLKSVLEQRPFAQQKHYSTPVQVVMDFPIVFNSNHKFPFDVEEGLRERFIIIKASIIPECNLELDNPYPPIVYLDETIPNQITLTTPPETPANSNINDEEETQNLVMNKNQDQESLTVLANAQKNTVSESLDQDSEIVNKRFPSVDLETLVKARVDEIMKIHVDELAQKKFNHMHKSSNSLTSSSLEFTDDESVYTSNIINPFDVFSSTGLNSSQANLNTLNSSFYINENLILNNEITENSDLSSDLAICDENKSCEKENKESI